VVLITQNVDDLHERGGSPGVLHMHGELLKVRCTQCEDVNPWSEDVTAESICPGCQRGGLLRPDIVWFGEMPYFMDDIFTLLRRADIFASIGTSGNVYPAAGFVQVAAQSGASTVEFNLEPSNVSASFEEHRIGPAGQTVPAWVEALLGS
jgi:NAD-dependent deacetylase